MCRLSICPRTTVGDSIEIFATNANFSGRIRSLVPTGDVRSQTFEARINLPASAAANWTVGQLVSVAVPIKARSTTLAVPRDALVLRNEGSFVFRITPENTAERIAVEIGDSAGQLVAVKGPLQNGDRVAIRGAENLREGVDVKILESDESLSSGAPSKSVSES